MRNQLKHERLKPYYPVSVFHIAALLVCLVLVTTYLLSGAYSKFYSGASGGDSARVTRFSPKFTSEKVISVNHQTPGYNDKIPFTVQNTSDDNVSEVAMKYRIVVKTTGNIPLKFTLLDNDENQLNLDPWDCDGKSGEREYYYTNDTLVFGVGTKETAHYKLKIEWPDDRKDARFSGMTDAVYLSAEFEQID